MTPSKPEPSGCPAWSPGGARVLHPLHARLPDERRLSQWWGERTCAQRWQSLVRPDGLGLRDGLSGTPSGSALSSIAGTEPRDRPAAKVERYLLIVSGSDAPQVVLLCFPSVEREVNARPLLRLSRNSVATTTLQRHLADPLGPVWRPVRQDSRVRLIDLARPVEAEEPRGSAWREQVISLHARRAGCAVFRAGLPTGRGTALCRPPLHG
jgi:hypothetical protein